MKTLEKLVLAAALTAPVSAEARESCNSVACVETIAEYNEALCRAARLYRYGAEAEYVARAYEANILNAEDHSLNWTPFFNQICPEPATDRADQEKLKLDLVLLNARVAERREWILKHEEFSDELETEVHESNKYALLVAKDINNSSVLIPPKIEEITQKDIHQWKLKTAWESLKISGNAFTTWKRKFKFLDEEMKKLDSILESGAPDAEKADATSAMLLAIQLMSNLGNPPSAENTNTSSGNVEDMEDEEDLTSFGPALIMDRTAKHKEPDMDHIKGPDVRIGASGWGYETMFWAALSAHMQEQVLPTFEWNQKAFLRNPNLSKFKGIDTKEAYKTALELTSKDMSSYPALLHLDKGIEDEDLNVGCRNPEDIRLGSASNAYAEAYKEYKVVCSEFDFSEDLFKETRRGIEIHTWPHYNLDNISSWGTENDPRFSFFTKVSE